MIDFIKSTIDKITKSTGSQLVYGESIVIKDKIIIPVAKISYGFGGGYGKLENTGKKIENGKDDNKNEKGNGGGGGLGLKAEPVGVIEIGEFGTRFISINQTKKMLGFFIGGAILGAILLGRRKSR
ncbi:MAG: hypothetical protein DRI95_11995 [Bacteroidetes bacterium]|nr:MAG: hypothetical protein DRI95_11995 [Bacteroidota bacterium]